MTPASRKPALPLASAILAAGLSSTAAAQDAAPVGRAAEVTVTATRLEERRLSGSFTTVIDRGAIERSPARTLPELLQREAGVQVTDLIPGTASARATIDLRGFGDTAGRNTLVLLNGRRLTDIDLSSVNFAAIPVENIERIELVRGNSAAVLYGQGAVGGAVNIVTRTPVEPGFSGTAGVALGSDGYREGRLSASQGVGPYNLYAFGNAIRSDGYRENGDLDQENLFAEFRHFGDSSEVYAQLSHDDQKLGLPGGRRVTPSSSELETDRRGTSTPLDRGHRKEWAAVGGAVLDLDTRTELVVDAGARRKLIDSRFYFAEDNVFIQDQRLDTLSLTPRIEAERTLAGQRLDLLAGIDLYRHNFDVETATPAFAFFTRAEANETSLAGYAQGTLELTPTVDLSAGLRLHGFRYSVSDDTGTDFDDEDLLTAGDLGLSWRASDALTLRARLGRSFRTPTVEERNAVAGDPFELAPQTSWDAEIGARWSYGNVTLDGSAYSMWLNDEIAYDPSAGPFGANTNYDETRRLGIELDGRWQATPELALGATLGLRRATFASGPNEGNDVPLVAPVTAGLSATWDVTETAWLSAQANYVSEQKLINDLAGTQPDIPAYTTVDVEAGVRLGQARVTASIHNLFDEEYFPYGVASTSAPGTFVAYPAPGRTFLLQASVGF